MNLCYDIWHTNGIYLELNTVCLLFVSLQLPKLTFK